jgi:hypothetical protein
MRAAGLRERSDKMNEREFCYWLQGLFEIGGARSLDEQQTQIVKDHLALIFHKTTPHVSLADGSLFKTYDSSKIQFPGGAGSVGSKAVC